MAMPLGPDGWQLDTMTGDASQLTGSCGGNGSEAILEFTPQQAGLYRFWTENMDPNFELDTVLYVTSQCGDINTELGCNDDVGDGPLYSSLEVNLPGLQPVYVVVDQFGEAGMMPVRVSVERLAD